MMSSVDFYRRVPKDLTEVSLLIVVGDHLGILRVIDFYVGFYVEMPREKKWIQYCICPILCPFILLPFDYPVNFQSRCLS